MGNNIYNLKNDIIFKAFFSRKGNEEFLIRKGTDYQDIEKIIMISILGYNMFEEFKDEYIHKTAIVLDKHRDYNVMDSIEWWFIELPKFRKINPDMSKKINQWIAFIDDEDKELIEMAEKNNKVLKKARKEITYLTGDDEVRRLAELREKWDLEFNASMQNAKKIGEKLGTEIGMKKGEKLGKSLGLKEEKIRIAKKMIEKGNSLEDIIDITELIKEEIEEIKKTIG